MATNRRRIPVFCESTGEVLPLLPLRYQHSASLFGFRWVKEDGGIEPLRHRCRTLVFKTSCRPFSGIFRLGVPDGTRTRY